MIKSEKQLLRKIIKLINKLTYIKYKKLHSF